MGYKNKAVVVGHKWMYGNDVHNMKNALASYVGRRVICVYERSSQFGFGLLQSN